MREKEIHSGEKHDLMIIPSRNNIVSERFSGRSVFLFVLMQFLSAVSPPYSFMFIKD